ncbi:MAG TPA: AAA family ATPase [Methylomirabilota bacterium]|nr:AAA family ATPase [Methylomirabilota bacterium]
MWVSSLEINNIKSFEASGIIRLDKKMNIILGANNSGKSTILRVLYQAQNPASLTFSDIRIGATDASAYLSLEEVDNSNILHLISNNYEPIMHIKASKQSGPQQFQVVMRSGTTENGIGLSMTEPDNIIYPYLSKRKVQGYRREVNRNFLLEVSDTLINLTPKVDQLANPYYPKHKEFEQACIDIIGFPISAFHAADNHGKQAGLIVDEYENIPIEAMGEGVPNLLGLIVSLCMAKNKLFIIEELENDIHPRALKRLLELIIQKAEYNQFVITTHSNIVAKYLGSIPGSKIHYVSLAPYSAESRIPTAIYREVGNTSQDRKEVLDDLGYDLVDYDLAKAWLFFEESSAERLVREFFIPWFHPTLKGIVNTVAAGGTSDVEPKFADFSRLFLFLHLESMYKNHAWVMVDGDSSGQKIIDDLKQKYTPGGWTGDKFINFSKENFEEYYPERFSGNAQAALAIQDRQERRAAKKTVFDEVLDWINSDQAQAKSEFEESAAEVKAILKAIEENLLAS